MVNFQKPDYRFHDANYPIRFLGGNPTETNKPDNADRSSESKKAELKELLQGKDNRPSYTKQQLLKMGFKEEYIVGTYFDQSSYNIADKNITLKMKAGLIANGKEIKTIYELLKALNNGTEIITPNTKPDIKTTFYRK